MSEVPGETVPSPSLSQTDYERVTAIVTAEFQVSEGFLELGTPTYYLKEPQETKQAFLRVLKNVDGLNMIAILRRVDGKIVLRIAPKPPVKSSNILVNWALFFATIATTFVTGYGLSPPTIDPLVGGASFTIAMLAVLGTHEMGHKIMANRRGIEATLPYFIPGLPPFGTFGAVIMQKSLPPNRDALFDVGADGPIAGFIIATVVSAVGLTMLVPSPLVPASDVGAPLLWILLGQLYQMMNIIPQPPPGGMLLLHPFAFAGWVGMVVTMLNLLPAAMLDGGHVARSIVGERLRLVLTGVSILFLLVEELYPMALLVLFISMYRHPGPLDDVSGLSRNRKIITIGLIAIFAMCAVPSRLIS